MTLISGIEFFNVRSSETSNFRSRTSSGYFYLSDSDERELTYPNPVSGLFSEIRRKSIVRRCENPNLSTCENCNNPFPAVTTAQQQELCCQLTGSLQSDSLLKWQCFVILKD